MSVKDQLVIHTYNNNVLKFHFISSIAVFGSMVDMSILMYNIDLLRIKI